MHEMSIATGLMEQILEVAGENKLTKIDEVVLETGVLRQVIPEVMQSAFESVTSNTLAEGAKLTIIEIDAEVQCKSCKKVFSPKLNDFLCNNCNRADIEILAGDDIILKSIISNSQ